MYDVVVIGAGVTGSVVARELSAYQLKTLVLEREEDVCCGTQKQIAPLFMPVLTQNRVPGKPE